MTSGVRKLALTAHVTSSVGWLGAVAAFLVLSIVGLTSARADQIRAAYLAMDLVGKFIIVPMSLAAVATGLIQGLGTQWGLTRHTWVLTKLVLSILATIGLLLHQYTAVAEAARRAANGADVGGFGVQLVADASGAILVLLAATALSIYKPWGARREGGTLGRKLLLGAVIALAIGFIVLHLAGGGMHHH